MQIPEGSLKVIAREGGGSMRDAQSLLDQVLSFSGDSVTEEEVAEILGFIDRSILYEVLGAALGAIVAGAGLALRRASLRSTMAYGPYLCAGALAVALLTRGPLG